MTFKAASDDDTFAYWDLKSTFARTFGQTIGPATSAEPSQLAMEAVDLAAANQCHQIHYWRRLPPRDQSPVAYKVNGEFAELVHQSAPGDSQKPVNCTAPPQARVLDVIRIEPNQIWFGMHYANAVFQRWPGGQPPLPHNPDAINRAYYKTGEALLWSGLPIRRNDICAEIGSAPGGSCQRLLETGAAVIAIDPANLDERIANHDRLKHLRMRGRDVRHTALQEAKWLLIDSNVAPRHSLDTAEGLVTGKRIHFQGLLITLKMPDWRLAEQIPDFIQRVKSWGFAYVKTRQLAWGGQEICLMGLKRKSVRRFGS